MIAGRQLTGRLGEIRQRIVRGSQARFVCGVVYGIIGTTKPKDRGERGEIQAFFDWVQDRIALVPDDPFHMLLDPEDTVHRGMAECESQVILLGSMLKLRRWPLKFKVVSSRDPLVADHIYLLVGYPRLSPAQWIPADTTIKELLGTEPEFIDHHSEMV